MEKSYLYIQHASVIDLGFSKAISGCVLGSTLQQVPAYSDGARAGSRFRRSEEYEERLKTIVGPSVIWCGWPRSARSCVAPTCGVHGWCMPGPLPTLHYLGQPSYSALRDSWSPTFGLMPTQRNL